MTKTVSWPKGAARQQLDFAMPRGVWVHGKVTEAPGDKPVADARVDFWSKGLKLPEGVVGQPPAVRTGADGTFRVVLPPGSYYVLVNGAHSDYLYRKIEADKLTDEVQPVPEEGKPAEKLHFHPDGWAALDAKVGAEPKEVAVQLRRVTLKGQLVGPDGKPVTNARLLLRRDKTPQPVLKDQATRGLYLDHLGHFPRPTDSFDNRPVDLADGRFEISVNDLEATYRLLLLDADKGLGAVAELKAKQAEEGPVTVRLAACGQATARFVDAEGKPLANYRPLLFAMLPPVHTPSLTELGPAPLPANVFTSGHCEVWMGEADPKHYGDGPRTDAEGRLTLPNLVPGATYRISQFDGKAHDFTVEAGKTVQLPDICIAKPDQTAKLPVVKPPR
jgi:hypothetical protein